MAGGKVRSFCGACGMAIGSDGACTNPRCSSKPREPEPARILTEDEIEQFALLLNRVQGRPLRVGERHWEVTDRDGFVVLRVESSDARRLAPFFAAAPEIIGRLLEHLAATSG